MYNEELMKNLLFCSTRCTISAAQQLARLRSPTVPLTRTISLMSAVNWTRVSTAYPRTLMSRTPWSCDQGKLATSTSPPPKCCTGGKRTHRCYRSPPAASPVWRTSPRTRSTTRNSPPMLWVHIFHSITIDEGEKWVISFSKFSANNERVFSVWTQEFREENENTWFSVILHILWLHNILKIIVYMVHRCTIQHSIKSFNSSCKLIKKRSQTIQI